MEFRVRPALREDVEIIAGLWIEMMREHAGFEPRVRLSDNARQAYGDYARQHVERDHAVALVTEALAEPGDNDGAIVGFLLAYRVRNMPMFTPATYGFVSDMTIAPGFRGRGLGRRMLDEATERFRDMGLTHLQLQVYRANEAGRRFWEHEGFAPYILGMWRDIS